MVVGGEFEMGSLVSDVDADGDVSIDVDADDLDVEVELSYYVVGWLWVGSLKWAV